MQQGFSEVGKALERDAGSPRYIPPHAVAGVRWAGMAPVGGGGCPRHFSTLPPKAAREKRT
jgi:hypothetical protein